MSAPRGDNCATNTQQPAPHPCNPKRVHPSAAPAEFLGTVVWAKLVIVSERLITGWAGSPGVPAEFRLSDPAGSSAPDIVP